MPYRTPARPPQEVMTRCRVRQAVATACMSSYMSFVLSANFTEPANSAPSLDPGRLVIPAALMIVWVTTAILWRKLRIHDQGWYRKTFA